MYLKKNHQLPKNKQGDCWLITGVNLGFSVNICVFNVALYESYERFLAGDDYLYLTPQLILKGTENPFSSEVISSQQINLILLAYQTVKNNLKVPFDFLEAELII